MGLLDFIFGEEKPKLSEHKRLAREMAQENKLAGGDGTYGEYLSLLNQEYPPAQRTNNFRGRHYEGPAHIQSAPGVIGHPYAQMPGNRYVPPQPAPPINLPRQGATTTPWGGGISNDIYDRSFYQEGGPSHKTGVQPAPNIRGLRGGRSQSPAITPSGSYDATKSKLYGDWAGDRPKRPDAHIAGATTRQGELAEFRKMIEEIQRREIHEKMLKRILAQTRFGGLPTQMMGLLNTPPAASSQGLDAVQMPSARQGFAPPPIMGGAY